ncbi:hypothetical protein Q3G72_000704 [Acer saccharum]|nr:hypothetical protein Q3G72_000704 [Acer saccharum]
MLAYASAIASGTRFARSVFGWPCKCSGPCITQAQLLPREAAKEMNTRLKWLYNRGAWWPCAGAPHHAFVRWPCHTLAMEYFSLFDVPERKADVYKSARAASRGREGRDGLSASAASRPRPVYPVRKCHNCRTYQRASMFRQLHKQVHMACADCYHKALYALDAATFKLAKSYMRAYRRGAQDRGYSFQLAVHEFCTFWRKPCHYCGAAIDTVGIDRVDNAIGYRLSNCVACCTDCNTSKGTRDVAAWLAGV